ncbi:MAG: hypothetical protein IJU79_03935 [Desulfovibrionaceae bacterium]|nr:hypothetical protein [Desulfovibrionaceae bacterium]
METLRKEPPAPSIPIKKASFPLPFTSGLEFNAPARGPWNIVHKALLIPAAHLIYVCARGCLRGVIMTAQEMGARHRLSWVGVSEEDLASGTIETTTFTSICAILETLNPKPPLILLYLSCIHKFTNFDYAYLLDQLNAKYPDIYFVDCYMMPTMRKSGITDEQRTYINMYQYLSSVKPTHFEPKSINFIANDRPIDQDSILIRTLQDNNYVIRDLCTCKTFEDYKDMAKSQYNLTIFEDARYPAKYLEEHLRQIHLHVPLSYNEENIEANFKKLSATLNLKFNQKDVAESYDQAIVALKDLAATLKDRPLALDYTFTPKPLSLARLLVRHGMALKLLFIDAFDPLEAADFAWLKENAPNLILVPTLAPTERFQPLRVATCRGLQVDEVLALGQKAAYLTSTNYFVNLVLGGGYYDYSGISKLCELIKEAHTTKKPLGSTILHKGLGCTTCVDPSVLASLGRIQELEEKISNFSS